MFDVLRRSGGINAMARQAGISVTSAADEAKALLPDLLVAYRTLAADPGEFLNLLEQHGDGNLAAAVMAAEPADAAPGMVLLDELSRVTDGNTGINSSPGNSDRAKIAPLLAMLVGGYVAARFSGGGLDANELDDMLTYREPEPPNPENV